jgi:hypothetical protein
MNIGPVTITAKPPVELDLEACSVAGTIKTA